MLSHRTGAQVLGLGPTTHGHTAQRIFIETGSKMHGTQPLTGCLQGCYGACRGGVMQHTGYELRRITVPRTWVNKGERKSRDSYLKPRLFVIKPLFSLASRPEVPDLVGTQRVSG